MNTRTIAPVALALALLLTGAQADAMLAPTKSMLKMSAEALKKTITRLSDFEKKFVYAAHYGNSHFIAQVLHYMPVYLSKDTIDIACALAEAKGHRHIVNMLSDPAFSIKLREKINSVTGKNPDNKLFDDFDEDEI